MAHDFSILKEMGSTNERIRKIFTAQSGTPEWEIREKWRKRYEARIQQGTRRGLEQYHFFAASDLAWDSNSITGELVPLMMFAQGKIQYERLKQAVKELPAETRKKLAETDKDGSVTKINIPEFFKVSHNLVRALITRRVAALSANYVSNFPLYKYEPRSTSPVAKLRGDVLSQRVEMIVDQYGYRHDIVQAIRETLLYPFTVEFVVGAWDVEKGIRRAPMPDEMSAAEAKFESYITREGVLFHRPHPSRVIRDNHHPIASLNFDNGLRWIGYWNVMQFSEIRDNPRFFNRDKIEYSYSFSTLLNGYKDYWELYFSNAAVNFPGAGGSGVLDLAGQNDREKQAGVYSPEKGDQSVFLTEYFERIIPKDHGLGDYSSPIWLRLVIAGGTTVVFGEFLPDTPGAVYQYNSHDGRLLNNAWATDILPYQDQLSNMLSLMLHAQKASLVKLIALDIDQINDPDVLKAFRETIQGDGIYTRPQLVEYKGTSMADVGMTPRSAITMVQADAINDVTMYMRSIMQILSLAERSLGISANENGQSEAREISATESANIATTVNTTLNFMGLGIDEGLDAKKRIVANSLLSLGYSRIQVPVANRYMKSTIEAAGFTLIEDKDDQQVDTNLRDPKRVTVVGTKDLLDYEYVYTSREGSERASNAKSAETLVNLLAQLIQIPGLLQDLGKEKLYGLLNEVVRLSGAGVDLRFELGDGETDEVKTGDPATDSKEQVDQAINQILQAVEKDRSDIAQLQQVVTSIISGGPAAAPAMPPAAPVSQPV